MSSALEKGENILIKAIEALKGNFNIQVTQSKELGSEIDLKFTLENKEITKKYNAEVKKRVFSSVIGQLLTRKKEYENILLITEYVSPKTANKLREFDIPFIDANGNVYLSEPEFYIFVNTHSKKTNLQSHSPSFIFQTTGLKLLFTLLSVPNSENESYRRLAEMSGISLGSVSDLMKALQKERYLAKEKDKRILFRKDELLKRWVQGYAENLSTKLIHKDFLLPKDDWWKKKNLSKLNTCWGGEVAAFLLTGYLSPENVRIYAKEFTNIVKKYKLRMEDKGKIKIIQKFWNFNETETIAPPLLIYADLLASSKARNVETAQIIYDEYLAGLIK